MLPARNTTNDSTMTAAPAALMNSAALADHAETTDTPPLPLGGPGRTAGGFSCFVEGTEARRHPSAGTEARRHGGTQQAVDLGRLVEMNKDGEAIEISIAEAIGLGRVRYAGLGASRREAVERTLSLGRWMAQVREHVPHGMFERLITDHGMNPRTVRLAIELADAVAAHGVDPAAFGTVRQLRRACGLHIAQANVVIPNAGRNRNHVSDLDEGRTSRDGEDGVGGGSRKRSDRSDGTNGMYAVRDLAAMRELYIKAGPAQIEEFLQDDGLEVVEVEDGELEGLEGLEDFEGDDDEDEHGTPGRGDAAQLVGDVVDHDVRVGAAFAGGGQGDVQPMDLGRVQHGADVLGGPGQGAAHGLRLVGVHDGAVGGADHRCGDAGDRAGGGEGTSDEGGRRVTSGEKPIGAGGAGDAVGQGVCGGGRGGEEEGTSDERRGGATSGGAERQPAVDERGADRVDAARGEPLDHGHGTRGGLAGGEGSRAASAAGDRVGTSDERRGGATSVGVGLVTRDSSLVAGPRPVQMGVDVLYEQATRVRRMAGRVEAGSLSDADRSRLMALIDEIEARG